MGRHGKERLDEARARRWTLGGTYRVSHRVLGEVDSDSPQTNCGRLPELDAVALPKFACPCWRHAGWVKVPVPRRLKHHPDRCRERNEDQREVSPLALEELLAS